ncbi:MAG: DUF1186 domain-containing protein [Thermodesulfobacteriota bacterium]|nr:DUF1186 domain-containing protein [Thermodesulfobacteriota bacterium]
MADEQQRIGEDEEAQVAAVLDAFRTLGGGYKRAAVEAAMEMEAAITPHLVRILENVRDNPGPYVADENLFDHVYALMLLGHFGTRQAHEVIVALFSLPDDLPDQLYGELYIDNLPVVLLNTCGGDLALIRSLAQNQSAGAYCRLTACQALAYAVIEGYAERTEVLEFLAGLFVETADTDPDFWGLLANIVCDLYPAEVIDVIQKAYEDGLIFPGMIAYDDFEFALERGEADCLDRLRTYLEWGRLDDLHEVMERWACFRDRNDSFDAGPPPPSPEQIQKKKAKARKKRKQAKASRKKNRK